MTTTLHTAGIVGVGLIGGTMAMAIKDHTPLTVFGWDRDPETLKAALAEGAIDSAQGRLEDCDILLIALYPKDTVDFVKEHAQQIRPGTLLIDLCGIKRYLCQELSPFCKERGIRYVGGHPMSGRETSGFASAKREMYRGASIVLTPDGYTDPQAVDQAEEFFLSLGFGRVVRTTPEKHDEIIAYTSQLAHVLSSSYIQNPLACQFSGFTGGSFQDLTRVSRLNCQMWGELFDRNQDMLCNQLDLLIEKLIDYKKALRGHDHEELNRLMEHGTAIKNQLLHELNNAE